MATLAQLNKALADAGIDVELVRGKGYYYFSGPAADHMPEQGLYGWGREAMTPDRVVAEARTRMAD